MSKPLYVRALPNRSFPKEDGINDWGFTAPYNEESYKSFSDWVSKQDGRYILSVVYED